MTRSTRYSMLHLTSSCVQPHAHAHERSRNSIDTFQNPKFAQLPTCSSHQKSPTKLYLPHKHTHAPRTYKNKTHTCEEITTRTTCNVLAHGSHQSTMERGIAQLSSGYD
mmetsp:Transcript_54723/g.88680  ORF Transcript_54723/g.88680 Transcript_54723/m.88680 type:complete len:109 (+) Transcript_54723:225-551(+)